MKTFKFKGILQKEGWVEDAYIQVDTSGRILSISIEHPGTESYESVEGYAFPGFQNAHSHAFQYAMAGLAERHAGSSTPDDFWSWRSAMYQLALSMNPDQMEAIASMLYAEMLRHGYTEVAEFHYVHHDKNGKPYENLAELGARLIAAAQKAGIKITLIPIYYKNGGFGKEASPQQRRFLSEDFSAYMKLYDASREACKHYVGAGIAYGLHSMRAVSPTDIKMISQMAQSDVPIHMHIAEQKQEIKESIRFLGLRPVEWLTEHINLSPCYHLVHATHMNRDETKALAESGAHVVLCPSTEGNLGDGLFPLNNFLGEGGSWSIGTDSHIGLNPFEELRLLDYGQRTQTHRRNTFLQAGEIDSGLAGISMMLRGGRKAMGKEQADFFVEGESLDALVMDARAPLIASSSVENLTSTCVYASDVSMHYGTMVNGVWKVKEGKHVDQASIQTDFLTRIQELKNR